MFRRFTVSFPSQTCINGFKWCSSCCKFSSCCRVWQPPMYVYMLHVDICVCLWRYFYIIITCILDKKIDSPEKKKHPFLKWPSWLLRLGFFSKQSKRLQKKKGSTEGGGLPKNLGGFCGWEKTTTHQSHCDCMKSLWLYEVGFREPHKRCLRGATRSVQLGLLIEEDCHHIGDLLHHGLELPPPRC